MGERIGSGPRSGFRVNEPEAVLACVFEFFRFLGTGNGGDFVAENTVTEGQTYGSRLLYTPRPLFIGGSRAIFYV